MAASEITDKPSNYLPNSFGHGIEAAELRLAQISEIECDIKVTLHFHG